MWQLCRKLGFLVWICILSWSNSPGDDRWIQATSNGAVTQGRWCVFTSYPVKPWTGMYGWCMDVWILDQNQKNKKLMSIYLVAAGVVVLIFQLVTTPNLDSSLESFISGGMSAIVYIYITLQHYITICVYTCRLSLQGSFNLLADLTWPKQRDCGSDMNNARARAHKNLRRVDVWLLVPRVAPRGKRILWAECGKMISCRM